MPWGSRPIAPYLTCDGALDNSTVLQLYLYGFICKFHKEPVQQHTRPVLSPLTRDLSPRSKLLAQNRPDELHHLVGWANGPLFL